ncbi:MAG: hypothetical protein ACJ8DV_11835, partial [Microvirga sp.]
LNVRLEGQGVTARLSGQMSIEGYLAPTCGEYKAASWKSRRPSLGASHGDVGNGVREGSLQYFSRSA